MKHSRNLPAALLPVQSVRTRHHAWAFITFSGPIGDDEAEMALCQGEEVDGKQRQPWRWPEDWIVLTKYAPEFPNNLLIRAVPSFSLYPNKQLNCSGPQG